MTSEQIKQCQAIEHDWEKEMAYQLAVMNERNAAQDKARVDDEKMKIDTALQMLLGSWLKPMSPEELQAKLQARINAEHDKHAGIIDGNNHTGSQP